MAAEDAARAEDLRPEGLPGVAFAGPFAVGRYAAFLKQRFAEIARVQLFGEVWNLRVSRAKVFFELRDGDGAVPCSMWRRDFDALGLAPGTLVDGAAVVVAGGTDFYPGSRTASPSFSFAVTGLRVAGEGDLLAQLDLLRKQLDAEGVFAPQKALPRPSLPRCIGVVTGEGGKARDDVLAGLRRRGWAGRLVWAFAPVQDRHAAPRIARALQDLAAVEEVEVVIVARGGGSLADLFAFCDETLCRTVSMLRVPVIASVGHHTDRTLIDDVAALSCSTPTHAAEAAVPCHPGEARAALARSAAALDRHAARALEGRARLLEQTRCLERHGRLAVLRRARTLEHLARAPAQAVRRQGAKLHQLLRELRAAGRRTVAAEELATARKGLVLARKAGAAAGPDAARRRAALEGLAAALAAHDPERTLARGYAIVDDGAGGIVSSAAAAREAGDVRLFFADGPVEARVRPDDPDPQERLP